jgi:hypothetical protein
MLEESTRTEGSQMAEKVAKLGVKREKDFMYYVKGGAVYKVPRKQPGVPKGKSEKVADAGVAMDNAYIYFVDKDGDVARAKRAIGGQKRKAAAKKAAKKPVKKKAAVKKAAKKPAKKPVKKAAAKKAAKKPAKKPAKKAKKK